MPDIHEIILLILIELGMQPLKEHMLATNNRLLYISFVFSSIVTKLNKGQTAYHRLTLFLTASKTTDSHFLLDAW